MALLVTSVNTANGQLLVRDTVTGTVSWKPGTADQIAAASSVINSGGTYNRDYIWPSDAEQPAPTLSQPPTNQYPGQYPGNADDIIQTPQQYPGSAADTLQTPKFTPAQMRQIFNDNNVKLDTGEYVSLSQYNKLTTNQQVALKAGGVARFNDQRAPVKSIARTDPAMAEQTFLIAKELNIPPEVLMAGATIVIPVGVASPEPISKLTAVIILAGLITAYGAVRAYRYFEDSQNQAAQEAAATARSFEEANDRPIAPADIIVATTDGALFSLEEGTIKTDTSGPKSPYEIKTTTAGVKDQTVIATSTAGTKDQFVIKTTTAAPKDQTVIKTDTFDPAARKPVIKNIMAVVLVGAPKTVKANVVEKAVDFDRVLSGLVDDYNRQAGILPQTGERTLSGSRYSNAFQKYLDTTAAGEAVGSKSHSAYQDYLRKRAALIAAWQSYVASANPTPVSGDMSPALFRAAALYQMNQYINDRKLSASEKQSIKTAINEMAQNQMATNTTTQTQTKAAEADQTQSATKTGTRATTRAATKTAARTADQTMTATTTGELELPELKPEDKQSEAIVFPKGTVAWRQGIGWWVIKPPYRSQDRSFALKKPQGATLAADAKSAIATIQSYGGTSPGKARIDMGIMDVEISSPPRTPNRDAGRKAIKFTKDKDQTYGGRRTTGHKVGPYHYKDGKISKSPLR